MSRIRADKLVSRTGTSAPELTYGASIPVGYGITGAGGINISGIGTVGSLNIASTQVISSARQLQNIDSLDATTTATIETAISNAPNTFTDLQVTGVSTFTNGPLLIGTGTLTGTAAQRLQVTGGVYVSDNVGIGTTNPTSKLHVIGDANITGVLTATTFSGAVSGTATSTTNIPNLTGAIISNNTTTSLGSFSSSNLATALTNKTGTGDNVFATSPTLVTPVLGAATATSIVVGSGVTINASGIIAAGIITATTFQSTSDINLKENIKTVNNSLNTVSQLRGVTFDWKNTHQASIGVIAQEVEQILPELVSEGEIKTVNYNGIIGILVEAIKEQQIRIEKLENKLNVQ